jgi:hypothetical protein
MFGDESGDPGMSPGSSPTFTLALMLFETEQEASACEQTISELRATVGVPYFHWVELDETKRKAFLNGVAKHDFYYVVQTLVKAKVKHRDFSKRTFFYERVAEKMAEGVEDFLDLAQACCSPEALESRVVLAKNGGPAYMRAMGKHLTSIRDAHGKSLVQTPTSRRAFTYGPVQLADMVCGAVLNPPLDKNIKKKEWKEMSWP